MKKDLYQSISFPVVPSLLDVRHAGRKLLGGGRGGVVVEVGVERDGEVEVDDEEAEAEDSGELLPVGLVGGDMAVLPANNAFARIWVFRSLCFRLAVSMSSLVLACFNSSFVISSLTFFFSDRFSSFFSSISTFLSSAPSSISS